MRPACSIGNSVDGGSTTPSGKGRWTAWRRSSRREVSVMDDKTALREEVRARYAASASSVAERSERACDCGEGPACCDPRHGFGGALYDALHREALPEAAVLASL